MAAAVEGAAALHRAHELHRAGRSQEAVLVLVAAIKLHPRSPTLLAALADVQRFLGRRSAEIAALEELTTLDPLSAEAWRRLGLAFSENGRIEDAYHAYQRAVEREPDRIDIWDALGRTALASQRVTRAEACAREMAKRSDATAAASLLLGHVHKALGQRAEAAAAYEAALAIDPGSSEALFNRVDVDVPEPEHPLAQQISALLETPAPASPRGLDEVNLSFAAARILERAGQNEAAFSRYRRANTTGARILAARGVGYRPAEAEAAVGRVRTFCPGAGVLSSMPLEPLPIDCTPIFIVGMPRSGSSLIEQILASHPRVRGGGELTIGADCERAYLARRTECGLSGPFNPGDERERALLTDARERYVDRLLALDLDGECVTDKAPGNFWRLGFLRMLFPDAPVVHSVRHPIATCWSIYTSNFAQHDPYRYSLEHLAHYYGCYRRLMQHWGAVLVPALTVVRYENLVAGLEDETRRLLEAIGLEWDGRCLDFPANPRPVLTASHADVRRPIYRDSVERWRRFEPWLDELNTLNAAPGRG